MKFSVPQFVTIEDKLRVGMFSFTFPQLFISFGAFLVCFFIYKIIGGIIALLISAFVIIGAIVIGWVKINNKYVYIFLPKLLLILISPKKYIWKEEFKVTTQYIKSSTLEKFIELAEEEFAPQKEIKVEKQEITTEKKVEKKVDQSLSTYVKKAIERGYNPFNPYINFPIPKFPKRRW